MKKTMLILIIFCSLNVFGKSIPAETLATVKFYKNGKVVSDQFEILRNNDKYSLLRNQKSKTIVKVQAEDIQSSIYSLLWKLEYKDAKHPGKCEKLYASISVGEETSIVCLNEETKVQKIFALLNRLNSIAEKN